MKFNFIVNVAYLIFMTVCIIFFGIIESWWSFIFGAAMALAMRDVYTELMNRSERRQVLRHRGR